VSIEAREVHHPGSLETWAHELAAAHVVSSGPPRLINSLARLGKMPAWLVGAQAAFAEPEGPVAKAAEWLLDNAYVVQRAVRQIREDMPAGFYARLRPLAIDGRPDAPRIYSLAHALLRAANVQLAPEVVTRFVNAYQKVAPLDMAEIWALPTMLRLACLELLVAALERLAPTVAPPFAPDPHPPTPPSLEDTECVARAIRSLATIASISWKECFRRTSLVDAELHDDPMHVYRHMDFDTCDRYRKVVEALARRTQLPEVEVARRAVREARRAATHGERRSHVGYWLIGGGRARLEAALGYRPRWQKRWRRRLARHATALYLLALLLTTVAAMALPAAYLYTEGASPLGWLTGMLLVVLPSSGLAVTVVHGLVAWLVPTRVLPKLAFDEAIPREWKTVVVIPTLLASREDVPHLLRRLERHFLANSDPALQFALLTDFADAPERHMPGDDALVADATAGIRALNARHRVGDVGPFHLLHRERRHNSAEGCWMGWERKRGKLDEFNRLLAGEQQTSYIVREGDPAGLSGVRLVITLDSDTLLPQGAAARLVGILAHPLNRPELDLRTGRVRAGYTVVQPQVAISPDSGNRSRFARLYSGDTSIDIYSRAVSNVYQDLFGAGIYVGKGIYDVSAFRRSLADRVPENALASHDLFEGIHGRAALASDVVLYEDYPPQYLACARRLHRWARGDWQLAPWLRRRVPGAHARLPNRLALIDRWKIADNLRRTLLPSSRLLLLLAGWFWLPGSPVVWTILALLAPADSLLSELVTTLARRRAGRPLAGVLAAAGQRVRDDAGRWLLLLVFLPHEALVTADAIVRTIFRLTITHRHLLEWTSAARTTALLGRTPRALVWREMAGAPLIAVTTGFAAAAWHPAVLASAAPLLVLWLLSPEIAARLSAPLRPRIESLSAAERTFVSALARRTWLFFETFVGPDDQWLPPDNYQEGPIGEIAHRTSPTNIGMMFLSTLAAWDLGYLGIADLAFRVRSSLETAARLEHYRGHLLNWYDSRTLEPLLPRYVSAVDSGNLAAALVALRQGCIETATGAVLRAQRWDGLIDTVRLLAAALARLGDDGDAPLRARVDAIERRAAQARDDPALWAGTIIDLCTRECDDLDRLLLETVKILESRGGALDMIALRELRLWFERTQHHLRSMHQELGIFLPWLALLDAPAVATDGALEQDIRELREVLPPTLRLDAIPARCNRAREIVACARLRATGSSGPGELEASLTALEHALTTAAESATTLHAELLDIAARADAAVMGMDFQLLYDHESRLLHIGYNIGADRLDSHHYDLLASEARLASLVAIANGDVPVEHWFALGRPVTRASGTLALLSWGGTMFEYLMPPILLCSHEGTLLAQSQHAAIEAQLAWGMRRRVPWGVSESGYALVDADQHYQYRAFGIPALGLRRDPVEAVVVTPYATALALPLRPRAAVDNLRRLDELGMVGSYGLYEALDFTPAHLPVGRGSEIVRSYMAHHQGMILAALDNHLGAGVLVRRFHADPRVQAAELLLHERVPPDLPVEVAHADSGESPRVRRRELGPTPQAWAPTRVAACPAVHVLGNDRLSCVVSESGAGALRWQQAALTRWVPDPTCDDTGLWIYVRDEDSGELWSAGRQPTGVQAEEAEVLFHAHMAEFRRRDHGIALSTEIAVSPSDDVEIRRVAVTNETDRPRRLSFTSYGEVVLAPPADDERHPAFSKLFVESEHLGALDALVFTRRPRRPDEHPPVMMHRVVVGNAAVRVVGVETDRARFLGRNRSTRAPRALDEPLSGTVGATLDPVMSVRAVVELAPNATEHLAFVTLIGGSRESLLETAERYDTLPAFEWAFSDAAAEAARELRRLHLDAARLPELQTLLSTLLYAPAALRCAGEAIATNQLGQPRLWGMGLSGDLPMLLLRMEDPEETALLEDLVRAHRFWKRRGIAVDLVVLWGGVSGYEDAVGARLLGVLQELGTPEALGRRGGIHLIRGDQIVPEERQLLEVTAGAVLAADGRSLAQQLAELSAAPPHLPRFVPTEALPAVEAPATLDRPRDLRFDNGIGGFSADGREYVIHLAAGASTPAPWCNVLANAEFGCLVTEAGGGYTWTLNSAEHRLTPWRNDPVSDAPAEALYLRDEENAEIWTPTPRPRGEDAACEIRHGAGYSTWRRHSHALEQTLTLFVAPDDPVKVVRLRLVNTAARPRRITATYYAEWVLGTTPRTTRPFVVTEYDATAGALLARSAWNPEFAERVAFLASDRAPHGFTTDRGEFLGREGDTRAPAALQRWGLSGTAPSGCDPCAALQVHVQLAPGERTDILFVLGEGRDRAHAEELLRRWRNPSTADAAWEALGTRWDRLLGGITVHTPDPAMDVILNRWLLYQMLAARVLARTGLYQSSGALGFRDQLQDVMALVHGAADMTRAHILACAERQFEDGDVLHWWHPPGGRGVRTRCSDDLFWLPYVTAHYVEATGDIAILDETVPFLSAAPLAPEEHDRYARFAVTGTRSSLFEHCRRALQHGMTSGPHGLPLIGDGDWNDAMNRVGARGRGESIWLGWFAIAAMRAFAGLCERRGEHAEADHWRGRASTLADAVEREAWDGAWYRRAYDDDGVPWGSATSGECCIDSVSQSWAVLSSGGAPGRVRQALDAAERALVRTEDGLICLLWPPFDATGRDPGYIKAYPPGIRENGGQYTHAAAWLGWAFAAVGDGDRAAHVFRLLNPITHAASREDALRYLVEPYVVAGDVGSVPPHVGRGGWTWYTGAAGWMWRLGIEAILGLQRTAGRLRIDPCVPREWPGFTAIVRTDNGTLEIHVENPDGVSRGVTAVTLDGAPIAGNALDLPVDGATHLVRVRLGVPEAHSRP
jgi:cyclic beta-1,2-glucan synthetase